MSKIALISPSVIASEESGFCACADKLPQELCYGGSNQKGRSGSPDSR